MSARWEDLRRWTQARIGLGRSGHSLSTKALLEFQWAHARARDAVHRRWNAEALAQALRAAGENVRLARSRATTREIFLQRPDLGRQLDPQSARELNGRRGQGCDLAIGVSDGLSAAAIDRHFLPIWKVLGNELAAARYVRAPLVLVPFGRVAISDAIGEALGAKLSVIILGERPGLTAADSLGVYLTYAPKPGTPDARRNCVSNIRPPEGLGYEAAARKLLYLIGESLRRQLSGIGLKDDQSPVLQERS